MPKKKPGWYGESQRHAMAAKGVKTGRKSSAKDARNVVGETPDTVSHRNAYRTAYDGVFIRGEEDGKAHGFHMAKERRLHDIYDEDEIDRIIDNEYFEEGKRDDYMQEVVESDIESKARILATIFPKRPLKEGDTMDPSEVESNYYNLIRAYREGWAEGFRKGYAKTSAVDAAIETNHAWKSRQEGERVPPIVESHAGKMRVHPLLKTENTLYLDRLDHEPFHYIENYYYAHHMYPHRM